MLLMLSQGLCFDPDIAFRNDVVAVCGRRGENDCCQVGLRGTGWAHGDLGWGRQQVGNIVFQNLVGVMRLSRF